MTLDELHQLEERIDAIEAQGGEVMTGYNGWGTGHIQALGNQTVECSNRWGEPEWKAFEFATEADAGRYVHEWCFARPKSNLIEPKRVPVPQEQKIREIYSMLPRKEQARFMADILGCGASAGRFDDSFGYTSVTVFDDEALTLDDAEDVLTVFLEDDEIRIKVVAGDPLFLDLDRDYHKRMLSGADSVEEIQEFVKRRIFAMEKMTSHWRFHCSNAEYFKKVEAFREWCVNEAQYEASGETAIRMYREKATELTGWIAEMDSHGYRERTDNTWLSKIKDRRKADK